MAAMNKFYIINLVTLTNVISLFYNLVTFSNANQCKAFLYDTNEICLKTNNKCKELFVLDLSNSIP